MSGDSELKLGLVLGLLGMDSTVSRRVPLTHVGPRSNIRGLHLPSVCVLQLIEPPRPRKLLKPVPNIKQPLIAIVDDDESVCRALERLICSLGMTAEIYVNSVEFVDLIEALPSFRPDCVVLDVQMAGLSGIEVQTRIRRTRGPIPVIFITAHDDRVARERAMSGGAVAFLHKPFNDTLLIRSLDAALGRGKAGEHGIDPASGE
jgi:CheY-like chemotaxis protein